VNTDRNTNATERDGANIEQDRPRLTQKQYRFLAELPFCETEGEAAKKAGVSKHTPGRWKKEPAFAAAFAQWQSNDMEMRRARLEQGVAKAIETMLALLGARDKRVALKAATELLDRAGYTAMQRVEQGVSPELLELLEKASGEGE